MLDIQVVAEKLDAKGPNAKGWYTAKCPAHDDTQSSLGITKGKRGDIAVKCHAGCKTDSVLSAIERVTGQKVNGKRAGREKPTGLTVAKLVGMKKLDQFFLQVVYRIVDHDYYGVPAVVIPYFNEKNKCVGVKYRLSESSHDMRWDIEKYPRTEPTPYGVAQLQTLQRDYKWDLSSIVLCEGESDTWTLVQNGIPALGISGAKDWQPEFADIGIIKDAKTLFVIQEPKKKDTQDDAGALFVKAISDSFRSQPGKVIPVKFEWPLKDPSEVWVHNQETFDAAWDKLLADAWDNQIPFTDSGNAERLVSKFGEHFRWLKDADEFRTWNGEIWEPSRSGNGALLAFTKEVTRAIADLEWSLSSESQHRRLAMVRLTKGEKDVFATRGQFDSQPMLLNVANGTLELETPSFRPFSKDDFLTFKAPVEYDPFALCPQFDDYLNFTFGGDEELIHFIVKAMAYTLTGSTSEQCFFMCHGNGGNGKSQLLELMAALLGTDLAVPAKFETFLETRGFNNTEYELASFAGARLITTVEPKATGRFNETLLKQMTGGDTLKARPIYGHPFAYRPNFKLWMAMNSAPSLTGTDEGIWRRVRYIPFNQTVPPERKIKDLGLKLAREEGPGILNRLLQGVDDWIKEGLKPPAIVEQATATFRETQDTFGRFIADRCVVAPDARVKCGVLYDAYKLWAEAQNEYVISAIAVSRELEARGFAKRRLENGEHRFGIGLLREN